MMLNLVRIHRWNPTARRWLTQTLELTVGEGDHASARIFQLCLADNNHDACRSQHALDESSGDLVIAGRSRRSPAMRVERLVFDASSGLLEIYLRRE